MRNIIILIRQLLLLFASSAVATYLKMCDDNLFIQSWSDLIGKPIYLWIAALLVSPFFELIYLWPAYVAAAMCYSSVAILRYKYLTKLRCILIGLATGIGIYLVSATLTHEWLMSTPIHNFKLFIIYTVVGIFYGWAYYHSIYKPNMKYT